MLNLVARGDVRRMLHNPATWGGLETYATEILPAPAGGGARYPHLDPALRDLLARCLARSPADRPDLSELLRAVEHHSAAPPPPPSRPEEEDDDDAVRDVVRALVYDAPTPASSFTDDSGGGGGEDDDDEDDDEDEARSPFCMGIFEIPQRLDRFWIFR